MPTVPTSQGEGSQNRRRGSYRWRGNRGYNMYRGGRGRNNNNTSHNQGRPPAMMPQRGANPLGCPYSKWSRYMKKESYTRGSELVENIAKLLNIFNANLNQFNRAEIEDSHEIEIDFQALVNDPDVARELPTLSIDIRNSPTTYLSAIGLILHELFTAQTSQDSTPIFFDVPFITVRLNNYTPITPLKKLKANSFGKFVAVRGTVVRVGSVKPLVTKMGFNCNSCGEEQVLEFSEGKYRYPSKCANPECRGKVFTPQRSSCHTETIDWQTVKVQEIMLDDQREAGRIPRTIECECTHGLVNSCVPGDIITVNGIVKVTTSETDASKGADKSLYLLYIHAVSITNSKDTQAKEEDKEAGAAFDFTTKELYAISEIESDAQVFRLVVGSLCPTIYGHELVKAGLVLALFGGTQKGEKNNLTVRTDPHILVVGDPGLGKSQMLQAAANVAPRGVYVCGNTTTTSGLTVTLSREAGSGDYALEAGALVLSDRGCCCIDEFDKMGNQHQALLEAMEQQSISIAKAGLVCSLPARASIIAAANPVGGHYNKGKTVSENLKMNSALLSRFDLVFILLDKPDEEMDGFLSEHVMGLHSEQQTSSSMISSSVTVQRDDNGTISEVPTSIEQWNIDKPLSERLKIPKNSAVFNPVPVQLLRKYIQYARKYVQPRLSTDAANVLQEFYLDLRRNHQGYNCTPITTRQLESLIRLTEARARVELREKATGQDAKDVVEIMKNSLVDIFTDDIGNLDFTRSQNGSGMSKRAQGKRFISELNDISARDGNSLFSMEQMYRIATQLKLPTGNFDDFIQSLNNQNFLLKKGPRLYQLQTSSCL